MCDLAIPMPSDFGFNINFTSKICKYFPNLLGFFNNAFFCRWMISLEKQSSSFFLNFEILMRLF